jgi:hypothetical protein
MASDRQHIYRQVFNSREGLNLASLTARVVCVLFRRGVCAAAFGGNNELLSIHYSAYGPDKPVWDLDFFEQLFHQEPMLLNKQLIKRFFVLSEQNMIVPAEFESENDVNFWFKSVHFLEPTDVIEHFQMKDDDAGYYQSFPMYMKELMRINALDAPIYPLPAFHFMGNNVMGVRLYCTITNEIACITLYHHSKLLWHKVMPYGSAEDIVYTVKLVCKEHKINADKVIVFCNALSADEYKTINELSQYFIGVVAANGDELNSFWTPVTSLLKQLNTCEL